MKTNTKYIFIFSLIILMLFGFFAWYVDREIKRKIEIVKEYSHKEIENRNLETGNKLKTETDNLASQEKIIFSTLIGSKEIINFISEIENIGFNLGMDVVIEKVTKSENQKIGSTYETEKIELNVQTNGSLAQIQFFVEKIMDLDESLNIKELKIYKTDATNGIYNARFILEGLTISYEKN